MGGALEVLRAVYPHQFAAHPLVVTILGSVGAAILLVAFGMWLMDRPEKDPESIVSNAKPRATGNQLTVNVHPPAPTSAPPQHVPAKSSLSQPQFRFRFAQCKAVLAGDDTLVRFCEPLLDDDGERCLALEVTNMAAEEGKQSRPARCVFATLDFKVAGSGGRSTFINRACWFDQQSNEISIGLSETAHIFVGLPKPDKWITYLNPNRGRENPRTGLLRTTDFPFEERIISWGPGASYLVEVTIVSNDTGSMHGLTLAKKEFTLEYRGISFNAQMLERQL